jgi:hypothetical protein
MTSPHLTNTEVISVFIDNERLDPTDLAAVLAAPGGRDLLLDLMTLRQLVQEDAASDRPTSSDTRATIKAACWLSNVAAACLVLASGYWLGRRSSSGDRPAIAPRPTQVIELQEGVNWHVPVVERRTESVIMLIQLLTTWMLLLVGAQTQLPPTSLAWSLELAAVVYYPDGQGRYGEGHTVWTLHPRLKSQKDPFSDDLYTRETLCLFSTPRAAQQEGYGWHVTMTPVRESENQVVVRVDWRRTRDRGVDVRGPAGSTEFTLQPGDRVPLDYIVPGPLPAGSICSATGMALELRLGPPRGQENSLIQADLWLVDRGPDDKETASPMTVRGTVHESLSYFFPDLQVSTATGTRMLRVFGNLLARPRADGMIDLQLSVERMFPDENRRLESGLYLVNRESGGGLHLAAATDTVLSVVLPPQIPGHQLSVRVRVRLIS